MRPLGQGIDPKYQPGTPDNATMVTQGRHQSVRDALQWLTFSHLPVTLQKFSAPFYEMAVMLIREIDVDSPELTTAFNKIIEAKDSAVRAGIKAETGRAGSVPRPQMVTDPPHFDRPSSHQPIGSPQVDLPNHPDFSGGNYGSGQPRPRPIQDRPQA